MPPLSDAIELAPDERDGGEFADQFRLGGEIRKEESEKGGKNAQEDDGGNKNEKPGKNVLEDKHRPTCGRNGHCENTFNLKISRIGEVVFGK